MFSAVYRCLLWLGLSFSSCALLGVEFLPRAAIFQDVLPGHDRAFAQEIARQVSANGYAVEFIGINTLTNASVLSTASFDLLVLPGARSLPASAVGAIENYLRQGGDLLALGLPAWDSPLFELSGRWSSRAEFDRELNAQRPQRILFDFAKEDLRQWSRASDESRNPVRHEITDADRGKALHVVIERFSGWETYQSPVHTNPFPPGHTLTCFRAKGTPQTRQLALEWTERDGSRWIATVDLTAGWRNYALPPEAFKAWLPPPARAGKEDHLRVENAGRLVVGIAHSHTAVEGNRQEYWIADIGMATNPFGDARLPDEFKPPHLECFSPGYQFFPISVEQASSLFISQPQVLDDPSKLEPRFSMAAITGKMPVPLHGLHPRPRGVGFNQDRAYRWEPLLAVRDAKSDDYRGAIAALLVHVKPPFRGGVWAVFTPAEPAFYRQPLVTNCLQHTLARMKRGVFLTDGGSEFFTVFENQPVSLGARAVNFGRESRTNLALRVGAKATSGKDEFAPASPLVALSSGETAETVTSWQPERWPAGGWRIVSELFADGQLVDQISHDLHVWRPKPKPAFIEARDGGFWLRGKPWKAHGVNYMPSSGVGLANWRHFEHWVGRGAYDPEVIERDLRRIKAMNLNSVSVFIHYESLGARHMLDFLRRCETLDLKVNLSLRPGTPMDFRWSEMKEMIQTLRLAQNDTVFAYDLAWEPRHEARALQTDYAKLWPTWAEKRYGSPDAARKAWGVGQGDFRFEIADFKSLTAPPMKWFTQDGPWRKLVSDYRLFLDDLLREKYAEARWLVKTIDPNHLVSFRMQHAGDSTFNSEAFLPYDFYGLAEAVDIWEPEAYGRIGDWEKVKPGRFTADYARLCDPTKPVLWSEMGYSVWDNLQMQPAQAKLEFQARYFSDFYRMLTDSNADGIFFWWYPGGYRLNEQSDYGIVNPDGTDRPVTKIIREQGDKYLKSPKAGAKPDYWIAVDRDGDARGLFGIYEAVKAEYWQAIAAGRTPGLKWVRKPGQAEEER